MQSREWQFHLGLRAGNPDDRKIRGLADAVVKQRGLADPSFAAQDDCRALTGQDLRQ
jgi:hypothetical protein